MLELVGGLLDGFLVGSHLALGLDDLALKGTDLLLGDLAARELLLDLLLRLFQLLELFCGVFHRIGQHLLLLGQELRVAGIHFQELVDPSQLGGQAAAFFVHVL